MNILAKNNGKIEVVGLIPNEKKLQEYCENEFESIPYGERLMLARRNYGKPVLESAADRYTLRQVNSTWGCLYGYHKLTPYSELPNYDITTPAGKELYDETCKGVINDYLRDACLSSKIIEVIDTDNNKETSYYLQPMLSYSNDGNMPLFTVTQKLYFLRTLKKRYLNRLLNDEVGLNLLPEFLELFNIEHQGYIDLETIKRLSCCEDFDEIYSRVKQKAEEGQKVLQMKFKQKL